MIVNGDGKQFLRPFLPYYILVKKIINLFRTKQLKAFVLVYSGAFLFLVLVCSRIGNAHLLEIIGSRIYAIRTYISFLPLQQHCPVVLTATAEKTTRFISVSC